METSGRTISRQQLANSYAVLNGPMPKVVLTATGQNNKYINPRLAEAIDNYSHSILVNLKAVEARKLKSVIEAFGDAEEIAIEKMNNLTFVHEIIVREGQTAPELPAPNEPVTVGLDWAKTKEGDFYLDQFEQKVLNVTFMKVTPAEKAAKFSFSSAGTPATAEAKEETRQQIGAESM